MTTMELFGCSGGMAAGFREAGILFDVAIDFDEDACASYERNLGHRPIRMDVRDLLRLVRAGWRGPASEGIDLLVADPPCTPWSRAGKRRGTDDERDMLPQTVALIELLRPRAYLIGNVPGLNDRDQWHVVQRYIGGLVRHGYCVRDYAELDAAAYSVPQHRIRPFWFRHLEGPCIAWPEPTHGPRSPQAALPGMSLKPYVTCREALGHLSLKELGRPVRIRKRPDGGFPPSRADEPANTVLAKTARMDSGGAVLEAEEGEAAQATARRKRKWHTPHAPSKPDEPAHVITQRNRSGHGGGGAVLEVADPGTKHPMAQPDEPAFAVTAHGDRAQKNMMELPGAPEVNANDKHPPSDPDEPSATIGARDRGNGSCALRLPDPNRPPTEPDAVNRTITGSGRGHNHLLSWPWDRPATTVQRDERLGSPGHHDENWQTREGGRMRSNPNAVILSEKAAMILQGLPENWVLSGKTKKSRWSQLGMLMPIALAAAVARGVRRQLEATGVRFDGGVTAAEPVVDAGDSGDAAAVPNLWPPDLLTAPPAPDVLVLPPGAERPVDLCSACGVTYYADAGDDLCPDCMDKLDAEGAEHVAAIEQRFQEQLDEERQAWTEDRE